MKHDCSYQTANYISYKVVETAISIYKKTMQLEEYYLNENDDIRLIMQGGCKIFSSSLVDKKPSYWDSKFIGLCNEAKLHRKSVKALIRDGIIDDIKMHV